MNIFRIEEGAVQILDVDVYLREAAQKMTAEKASIAKSLDWKGKTNMSENKNGKLLGMRNKDGRLKNLRDAAMAKYCDLRSKLTCEKGQGTTEYAILVGVLVVIAIIAITVFRPKLEELWTAISDGISSL